jgi:hypothetical protein
MAPAPLGKRGEPKIRIATETGASCQDSRRVVENKEASPL